MKSLAIAILLFSSVAHAEIRPYVRWLPVAYFDGIDNPPRPIGKALAPGGHCDEETIGKLRKQQRLPESVVIACKPWTPKSDDNL